MNHERLPIGAPKESGHREVLDFAEIRNPLGVSPKLSTNREHKRDATENQLTREIAELWGIPPDMIVLARGSTDIIDQIPSLFLTASDRAVLPVPTYFGLLDKIPEKNVIEVPLFYGDSFAHTEAFETSMLTTIQNVRPRLVWLCSPNNPTGLVIPRELIKRIASVTTGIVIVDEAYQEYVDPENTKSALSLIDRHPNIVVTRTFSKAYGLPDIRVGVGIGSPDLVSILRRGRLAAISQESLVSASAALLDQEHIRSSHSFMARESDWLWNEIRQFQHIEPGSKSESGVFLLRHKTGNLFGALQRFGIKTTDFNDHRGIKNMRFVRIGISDRPNNITLLRALNSCDQEELL